MILINNNFEQKVKRIKNDENVNFLMLDMNIEDKDITLVNIYGPISFISSKVFQRNELAILRKYGLSIISCYSSLLELVTKAR